MLYTVVLTFVFFGDLDAFDIDEADATATPDATDGATASADATADATDGASAPANATATALAFTVAPCSPQCVHRIALPAAAAVEAHVKRIPAEEFLMYMGEGIGDVRNAQWIDGRFAAKFDIETKLMPDSLREALETRSLEDGEYEASDDNGWSIKCGDRELGTIDYRHAPISITLTEPPASPLSAPP